MSLGQFNRLVRKTATKKKMRVLICCVAALSTLFFMYYSSDSSGQESDKILHRHTRSMKPMIDMRGFPDTEGLCPHAGFFRNKTDCTQFYRCVDFNRNGKHTVFRFMCGPMTVFDPSRSLCTGPRMAVPPCTPTPPTPTPPPPTPPTPTPSPPTPPTPTPPPPTPPTPTPSPPTPTPPTPTEPADCSYTSRCTQTDSTPTPPTPTDLPPTPTTPTPPPPTPPTPTPTPPTPTPPPLTPPTPTTPPPTPPTPTPTPTTPPTPTPPTPTPPTPTPPLTPPTPTPSPTPPTPTPSPTPPTPTDPPPTPPIPTAPPSTTTPSTTTSTTTPSTTTSTTTPRTPKPETPPKPPFSFDCTSDKPLQFPLDCSRFYQCVSDGVQRIIYVFSCLPGLYFDDVSSQCRTPAEAVCKDTSSINDTSHTTNSFDGPGGILRLDCNGNLYRYPLNCNNFYTCFKDDEGHEIINVFACAAGLVFDDSSLRCLLPQETSPCGDNNNLFKSPSFVFQLQEEIDTVSILSKSKDIFEQQKSNLPKHGELSDLITPKLPHQSGRGASQNKMKIRMNTHTPK